jgi:hypothetical protein
LRRFGRRAFADRVELDPQREGTAESVTDLSIMGTRKDKVIRVPHSVAVVMAAAEQACLTMRSSGIAITPGGASLRTDGYVALVVG